MLEERLALRLTSEAAMYPFYVLWVRSRRDISLKLYQSGIYRRNSYMTHFVRQKSFSGKDIIFIVFTDLSQSKR
ncbi:MAG: hypothetical protein ACTSW1_09510 [Candidatus Hodarchaeales archaeon]